jgi:hypothetical protein
MSNHFVARVTGTPDRKNRAWQAWAVIDAPWDMTVEKFHEVLYEIHPEEYLIRGDFDELEWSHKHSGHMLIKAFKFRGEELHSVHTADEVEISATTW